MHILVIGATGQSGVDFVREALAHSHSLTLYVRSPGKLPQDIKDNAKVTILQGGFDAYLETIRPAITNGAEAIVSTAGPIASNNGNGTPVTDFYEKLYKLALEDPSSKIRRTLILNTCSYKHPGDGTRWIWRLLVSLIHKFQPDAYREINATGKLTSAQPVDKIGWTLFRVPFLTNGAAKPTVATIIGSGEDGLLLSRKSLAAWLVKELEEGKWIGKAPVLSSGGNWL